LAHFDYVVWEITRKKPVVLLDDSSMSGLNSIIYLDFAINIAFRISLTLTISVVYLFYPLEPQLSRLMIIFL
jgi:hypothetical protein